MLKKDKNPFNINLFITVSKSKKKQTFLMIELILINKRAVFIST